MQTINIGLIGLGTVGIGVYKIIKEHQDELTHQTGFNIHIHTILVRDVNKDRGIQLDNTILTDDSTLFLESPDIDIIVEVAGGIDSAYTYIKSALFNHKHVVTANKDLMAVHGIELLNLAKDNHCDLFFEASVGGGIPIIRTLMDSLASDKITEISGIVNGTTNYIFTKMDHEGMTYDDALKKAQQLGFAESDPTSDVGGFDAGRKMAILATLAFSMPFHIDDVRIKGMDQVSDIDLNYAKQLGYEMKLLGIAKLDDGAAEVSVEPALLSHAHPLTSVHDEYNAVMVRGEALGTTMYYGAGAGSMPTANAIVSDVVSAVKDIALGITGLHILAPRHEKKLKTKEAIHAKYFLRIMVKDEVGVFADITSLFAKHNVSFERIVQDSATIDCCAQIIIVTHDISLKDLEDTLEAVKALPSVREIKSYYRIEGQKK